MQQTFQYLVSGVMAALLAAAVAACGSSGAPSPGGAKTTTSSPSAGTSLYQQAKAEGTVVWNSATAVNQMQPVLTAFEKTYPGVHVQYAVVKPPQLVTTLESEEAAHHVTVDVGEAAQLDIGPLVSGHIPMPIPTTVPLPAQSVLDHRFVVFQDVPTVVIYNRNQVSPNEVPKTWSDLLNPRWRGKLALDARGTFLSVFFHNPAMGGTQAAIRYAQGLRAQHPYLESNLASIEPMVVSGQVALGTDALTEAVFGIQRGEPIGIAPISPVGDAVFYVFIPKGAPHPAAAELLVQWLGSPAGQRALTAADAGRVAPCNSPEAQSNALSQALCPLHVQLYAFHTLQDYEQAPAFFHSVQQALGSYAGR